MFGEIPRMAAKPESIRHSHHMEEAGVLYTFGRSESGILVAMSGAERGVQVQGGVLVYQSISRAVRTLIRTVLPAELGMSFCLCRSKRIVSPAHGVGLLSLSGRSSLTVWPSSLEKDMND